MECVVLKIRRQESPEDLPYWEEFEVPLHQQTTLSALLLSIAMQPRNRDGLPTSPVVWDDDCSIVVNGRAQLASQTHVTELGSVVILEPLRSFPVIRDLRVDRTSVYAALAAAQAWVDVDLAAMAPQNVDRVAPTEQQRIVALRNCTLCGACAEASPQYGKSSPSWGAFVLAQMEAFNRHPAGRCSRSQRLEAAALAGGVPSAEALDVADSVCVAGVPLSDAVSAVSGDVTVQAFRRFFRGA